MSHPKTLQITLQHPDSTGWPVSATLTTADGLAYRREDKLALSENWEAELRSLTLQPDRYGEYLGCALFHDNIRDICKEALNGTAPTRLYLIIEAPQLQTLRWERLHYRDDTNTWASLAQNQQLLFSYYTPSLSSRNYATLHQHDLRALVMVCSPPAPYHGFQPFDTSTLAQQLADSFGERIPHTILVNPADATWPKLLEQLNTEAYPLLHIIAHGYYDEDRQESYLLLLDAQQQPTLVSATAFTQPLKHANRLPHLIFFSSCETATPAANLTPHGHFARQVLDQWGTPAVIAMSDTVSVPTAAALAAAFYSHLYYEAHVDLALTKAGIALQQRADRYLPVLYQRLAGKALFSKDPKRHDELNQVELEQGLDKLAPLVQQRAPAAQTEFDQLATAIRTHQHDAVTLNSLNQLCLDVTDISFATLVQDKDGSQLTAYNAECPFPGMRPFKAGDAPNATDYRKYFFGRDHTVGELLKRFEYATVLAVIGASGSGKSSLVFAGLIPKLEQHTAQQGQQLQVISLRLTCHSGQAAFQETPQYYLQQKLHGMDTTQPALLYVDQFEELFTLCQFADKAYQEQVRKAFLQTLFDLPAQYPLLKVLFTIRDDFTGDAASYPALKTILQDHAFLLARMDASELRTAIEQQAAAVNLIFEQGLVHQILSDVDGEPGAMPLLQHLLWLLWQRRRGRYLRTAEYTAIGGVKKAIAETADKLFHHYQGNSTTQKYLRNIFLRLTRPGKEHVEDSSEYYRDTRQRVPRSNLYPSDADPVLIDALITQLADERLIVTYKDDVEIAHESLITYWDTLRDWLKDRQLIEMQQGLVDAARNWQQARLQHTQHIKDLLLHRGSRIKDIEQQQNQNRLFLTQTEADYLQACRQQDKREIRNQRYMRVFAVAMLCLFMLAAMLWGLAVKQKNKADEYLMQQHLYRGIELRDNPYQAWDKAEKYFAKALDVAPNETQKENLLFAYADLHRFAFMPKSTMHHEGIQGIQTFTNKHQILTWSSDGTIRIWDTHTWDAVGSIKLDFVTDDYSITDLKLFADNKRLLVWGGDTVRVVDVTTGASLTNMPHPQAVEGAELFAGDTRLLAWDRDGTARVWDVTTGVPVGQPMQHGKALGAVILARDTRILTWSQQEGSVQLWDAATGVALGQPKEYEWGVTGVQKFADDRHILIWTIDGIAQIWDTATWKTIGKPMHHAGVIYGAHIFANGSRILTWSQDGTARVWNASSGELIGKPMHHEKAVNKALIFANDTRILTLGTENDVARLWDAATGEPLSQPLRQQHGIHTLPEDTQVLTWDKSGVISVWDMAASKAVSRPMQHRTSVSGMQLFAGDTRVLTWSRYGTAQIWDIATGEQWGQTMTHDKAIRGAKVFANDTRIVTWSEDGTAKLWNAATGQLIGKPMRHSQGVKGAQLIANDTRIVTWSEDGYIREWDAVNGNAISDAKYLDDMMLGLRLFADNTRLLIWAGSSAQVIDTATGKNIFPNLQHKAVIWGAEVFADNTRILTWSNDHTAQVWNAATGGKIGQPMIHTDIIRGAKVFANNTRVLTWSKDKTARIWDVDTGKAIGQPMIHKNSVAGTQVFSNDTRILTWNWNGTAQIWDAMTGAAISLPIGYGTATQTAQVFANGSICVSGS